MVKVDGTPITTGYTVDGKRKVKCSLIADESADIIAIGTDGSTVEGLGPNDVIDWGSDCFTCEQELLMLNSSGQWI